MRILVGSNYFFSGMDGFRSKDTDYVTIVETTAAFSTVRQIQCGRMCLFEWKRMPPDAFVAYSLEKGPSMQVGKFLVPEFCAEIGFTLDHLRQLQPVFDALDEKHAYERIIYEAYLENGKMELTDAQRERAFESYKSTRKNNGRE